MIIEIQPGEPVNLPPREPDKWDARWMSMAEHVASWSKDRSTKVGCVIVRENRILSLGYNGFPRRVDDDVDARHERPAKYQWTEHAERNAIYNAAREGIALAGAEIYIPWFPCIECSRAIIQADIWRVVAIQPVVGQNPRWDDAFVVAEEMLTEAEVDISWFVR